MMLLVVVGVRVYSHNALIVKRCRPRVSIEETTGPASGGGNPLPRIIPYYSEGGAAWLVVVADRAATTFATV